MIFWWRKKDRARTRSQRKVDVGDDEEKQHSLREELIVSGGRDDYEDEDSDEYESRSRGSVPVNYYSDIKFKEDGEGVQTQQQQV